MASTIYTRIAPQGDSIFVDLCNPRGEAVEIAADGYRVVSRAPVRFRRTKGALALPFPVHEGSILELRTFVNLGTAANFVLCVAWLIACFRPRGPYPILILVGEQGSAKSTTARMLRELVDPSTTPLRSVPQSERDLRITAHNSWVLPFDNMSGTPPWLADALCRLATGGGFSTRELYSDRDETLFDGTRPIILNGIEPLADRPDLADRAIVLELPPIGDRQRRAEDELTREWEQARPRILGALMKGTSMAIQNLPDIRLPRKPRMADFACWAVAAEAALPWKSGVFMTAYDRNRASAVQEMLDKDTIVDAIRTYLGLCVECSTEGTVVELLTRLTAHSNDNAKSPDWPKSPSKFSGRLRRLAPALRTIGVSVEPRRSNGRRVIRIAAGESVGTPNSADPADPAHVDSVSRLSSSGSAGSAEEPGLEVNRQ